MLCVFFFQISVIPDTLNIKSISRLINALMLLYFVFMLILILKKCFDVKIFLYYVFPVFTVILGFFFNFVLSFGFESLGQLSKFIPWLSFLIIPILIGDDFEKCWHLYYKILVFFTLISLLEYTAIFMGFLTPTMIETDRGVFFKGIFSILHYLDGGVVYYRYYGVFAEPGTAAMFMIPGIAYALIYSKLKSLFLFLSAFFLTFSLGGAVSLLVLFFLYFQWRSSNSARFSLIFKLFVFIFLIFIVLFLADDFIQSFIQKQNSATVRVNNVEGFFENFFTIMLSNPFGLFLNGKSFSSLSESNEIYLGSNFTFYVAFVQGGVIGFIGYTIFFLTNCLFLLNAFFKKHNENKVYACVIISLPAMLLFCFQRTTILESALYSFLYGSVVLYYFSGWMLEKRYCKPA